MFKYMYINEGEMGTFIKQQSFDKYVIAFVYIQRLNNFN